MSASSTLLESPITELHRNIDRLAEVAVQVGLGGFQPGQELVITAPLEALPMVRLITEHAYRSGASLVTTLFSDEESTLLRFRHAGPQSFDRAAEWLQNGLAAAYRSGAARLAITGGNPSLLAGQDGEKVTRANRAFSKASRPALELITRHEINWTIVPCSTPGWAAAVFPNDSAQAALEKLWQAIFAATRVDQQAPVNAWRKHDAQLRHRAAALNEKSFAALHFRGPGTDLRVGLANNHLWMGGGTRAGNGIDCIPNLPTEEVFTTPHKDRVDGSVTATKPLSYQGTLIENIRVRFEAGRIVESDASKGANVLKSMIETDEGARRLGEVALVPHSSPISKSGLLFWNTLFDENASSHIALGQTYSTCLKDGDTLDKDQLAKLGANDSLIHVDWMIGSGEITVDGICQNGSAEPLMKEGEWVS